jgi:hypothetical protein
VGWAWYEHKFGGDTRHYNSVGTVGLGPIAMAVKVRAVLRRSLPCSGCNMRLWDAPSATRRVCNAVRQ